MKTVATGLSGLLALALLLLTSPAQALLELKGGYSLLSVNPQDINDIGSASGVPKLASLQALNVDAFASLPAMPVGLGVRYETFTQTASNASGQSKANWTRVSVLLNKRIVDTGLYLGSIATIGISNDFNYKTTVGGVETSYHSSGNLSLTAGFEAGVKLAILRLGAEAGYMYAPLGTLKNGTAGGDALKSDGSIAKVDLSGPYLRLLVGFGF